jgi:hypothetical protein
MTTEPNPSNEGTEMTAIPYDSPEEGWDGYDDDGTTELPGRRRRQFWTRGSAALIALLVGAIGFYVGVRVEKGQVSSSGSTSNPLAALAAARGGAASGASGASRTGAASGASGASRSGAAGGFGGRGGFAAALGGGNGTFGTVSSISGNTLYVTQTATGNVVKVELSGAAKITKSVGVGKSAIHPGDTLIVQGVKGSNGTITATTVSDSGASASSTSGSGSSATSGSGSSGSSAVSSLFGSGGGGG